MKRAFKLMMVAFASVLVVSCGDVEEVIYNGNQNQNDTFLSFTKTIYTLPIVRDNDGSVELVLQSSTVSNVDRVYNLAINTEESTANPAVYSFPPTITIPAGSYTGTGLVEGDDIGVTSEIETVVFSITNLDGAYTDVEEITLNIVEVCPLEDEFTGTYTIATVGGINGIDLLAGSNVVELVATGEYERQFTISDVYIAGLTSTVSFTLTCGQTFLAEEVDTGVYCTEGNNIIWGVASSGNTGTYDFDDDSVIEVGITEDINGSCQTSQNKLILTKVE